MEKKYPHDRALGVPRLLMGTITALTLIIFPYSNTDAHSQWIPSSKVYQTTAHAACEGTCSFLTGGAAASNNETLFVVNASEEINGDISSPAALIANPGPDGISLVEAVLAAEGTDAFDTIRFDTSMMGAVINFTSTMLVISRGNLLIDGDIDGDGAPDVTLDGSSGTMDNGFTVYGASHVLIKGVNVQNFRKDGVLIFTRPDNGLTSLEDIVIYQSSFSGNQTGIDLNIGDRAYFTVQNVEIIENTIQDNGSGISIIGGMGGTPTDNTISGVSILDNRILDNDAVGGVNVALFVSPAASYGASRNTISDLEIRGNQISGHPNSIIVDASNQAYCNNNTTDQVSITDNEIDSDYVTIEFVTESGMYSSGNMLSNIEVSDNHLTNGGIHFGGATGYAAHNNTTQNVLIDRNQIVNGKANGIYMVAASGGAYNNLLQNVILRSNFIRNSTDAGILLHATADYGYNTITNVIITNQTLVNNGLTSTWSAGGININSKSSLNTITGVTIANSILWGNNLGDSLGGSLLPDSVRNTLLGDARFLGSDDNFYLSPEFVDPANDDYHIQSTSPCVDAGDPTGASVGVIDLDLVARLWDGDGDGTAVVDCGAWEYGAETLQEMNVLFTWVPIYSGDRVPAPWDGTDFGAVEISGEPMLHTFTIENTGSASLLLTGDPVIEITGVNADEFQVTAQPVSEVDGSDSITFTIAFSPLALGDREAVVTIANNDPDEDPYIFVIQGTGLPRHYWVNLPLILAPAE